MKHHTLDGKDLYHCAFKSPPIRLCTFSEEYGDYKEIVRLLNFGTEMLKAYEQSRYDKTIENVALLMRQLECSYRGYQQAKNRDDA